MKGMLYCEKGFDKKRLRSCFSEGTERGDKITMKWIKKSGLAVFLSGLLAAGVPAVAMDGTKNLSTAVEKMLNGVDSNQAGERIQVSFPGDVMFDSGKWGIKKSAEKLLYKFLGTIKGLKIKEILIEGYTDSQGPEDYNLTLSRKRAISVKNWLVEKGGLDGTKIVTKGYGESKPIAPNTNPGGSDNPGGRAKNRRVEVYVTLLGG
jgi:outer membrane protein OmpA-like peptidoglycan-associated protein